MTMTKIPMDDKQRANIWRYVLTGAGLGLYFGFLFRPVREPSLLLAIGLSFLAALVTIVIHMIRQRKLFTRALLVRFFKIWGQVMLGLVVLELRHPVYDLGGKAAVTVMTTAVGVLVGLWYWQQQNKVEDDLYSDVESGG